MKVELLSGTGTRQRRAELAALLGDAVAHGARLGFGLPLEAGAADAYWQGVASEVATGGRVLLVALDERGRLVGSAQLLLDERTLGRDRAQVQKVMVKHSCRGRGIGAALMARIEAEARAAGRSLLVLDTTTGASGASVFCRRMGYACAGEITTAAPFLGGRPLGRTSFVKRVPAPVPFPLPSPAAAPPPGVQFGVARAQR